MSRRNSYLTAGIIGVLLLAGLITLARHSSSTEAAVWFFDLNTGELFAAADSLLPPTLAPSGDRTGNPAGVLAHVLRVDDGPELRIAFLETYTPAARELLQRNASGMTQPGGEWIQQLEHGTLIALPPEQPGSEPQWIPATDPRADELTRRIEDGLRAAGHRTDVATP